VLTRRDAAGPVTLMAATDGNHGRALAWMARLLGQRAHVFVPSGVHPTAVAAIAAEGAQVTEITGTYDDAVRLAAKAAREPDAELVQDAGWPGYEDVPGWIVDGYSTLFAEVDEQLAAAGAAGPAGAAGAAGAGGKAGVVGAVGAAGAAGTAGPALVAIPAGVGSLAQAAVIHYRSRPGSGAPSLLTVEPGSAAGVLASLARGELGTVATGETIMSGLNCGTPSTLAWPYLRDGLDAAIAVANSEAAVAARDLAGYGIPAGPCGGAALAGVRAALTGEGAQRRRAALALDSGATVVLLSTEGSAANPVPPDSGKADSGKADSGKAGSDRAG
jgi:diaminopropionate ammonia-lyase